MYSLQINHKKIGSYFQIPIIIIIYKLRYKSIFSDRRAFVKHLRGNIILAWGTLCGLYGLPFIELFSDFHIVGAIKINECYCV